MRIQPLHDRIVATREELPAEDIGSLIITPEVAKEQPQSFRVVAVGDGRLMDNGTIVPLRVQPGMLVLAGKYSGTDIKVGRNEYTILREDEVAAVLHPEES